MSGGIAYVLDEVGDFDYYCNKGLVDLTPVEDKADIKELQTMINNHLDKYTKYIGIENSYKLGRVSSKVCESNSFRIQESSGRTKVEGVAEEIAINRG